MIVIDALRGWARKQQVEYAGDNERPLGGYVALMSAYAAGTAAAAGVARAAGRSAPQQIGVWDVAQLTLATHKISRLIAKDPVTSPIRAPFTRYDGRSAAGELSEQVRGEGLRHSVGELLTCPMCLGQWVATGLVVGLTLAPRLTRPVLATFTAVAGADFLHHAYAGLQQATE